MWGFAFTLKPVSPPVLTLTLFISFRKCQYRLFTRLRNFLPRFSLKNQCSYKVIFENNPPVNVLPSQLELPKRRPPPRLCVRVCRGPSPPHPCPGPLKRSVFCIFKLEPSWPSPACVCRRLAHARVCVGEASRGPVSGCVIPLTCAVCAFPCTCHPFPRKVPGWLTSSK